MFSIFIYNFYSLLKIVLKLKEMSRMNYHLLAKLHIGRTLNQLKCSLCYLYTLKLIFLNYEQPR